MSTTGTRRRLHFSIGFKLITITSIIVAASLGGMIFLASYFFRDDNEIRIKETNLQVAGLIAKKVFSDVTAVVDKVGMIGNLLQAEKERTRDGQAGDGKSAARAVFDNDRDILFAAIVERDDKGEPVIRERLANREFATERGQDEAGLAASMGPLLPLLSGSFSGQSIVANPSPRLGYGALAFAVPYQRVSAGEARSILVIILRLERFNETVKSQGITKSYIVNGAGDVLAHFDQSLVTSGANLAKSPVIRMMLKSTNPNGQTRYQDTDGRWYLGSFQKIEFADLGVVVYVDEEKAFEAVYRIQRRNMIITALVLNFAMLVVWFFAKTITRPVKSLAGAALQVKEGQYDIGIRPTTRDEIGDLTGTFVEMAQGLAEREKMKEAFGKFVNKEIAEKAMKGELKLGGERKDVAIFFSDIRSFTAISEKLQPEEVVEFLNAYMTRMVACVNETHGVVDKFIGDAIMAVWGTPVSHGNDIENAINGALMMRKSLIEFNADRGGPGKPLIKIGCGINVGPVIAGQIGSHERMEYTVIGDAVNLASRIESLNKPFGTDILISEDAWGRVDEIFITHPMQKIKVKGKTEPQQIYAVIGRRDDPASPRTLDEVRTLVGVDMSHVNLDKPADEGEVKYEILE